jgi:tetratricopeptide (TPR) repeat protein
MALSAVKQDRQAATAHLERAIAIDPRQPVYYQDLAGLYAALRRPADAKDVLARAVRNTPATDALVTDLVEAYLVMGEYREAAQALAEHRFNVTEGRYGVHDDYALAWIGVALESLRKDDPQAALVALDKALEYPANLAIGRPAEPQDESTIHFWRGVALRQLNRPDEATKAFEQAAGQAVSERGRRRGFYRTVNAAHGILALRALGRPQDASSRIEQLTRGPTTRRYEHQDDFYRAATAFREAWGSALRTDPIDAGAFGAASDNPHMPGQWLRLSLLAAEVLEHGSVAATRQGTSDPRSIPETTSGR